LETKRKSTPPIGTLYVTLIGARNTKNMDLLGKNDLYGTAQCGTQKFKTRTISNAGANCTWDQTFQFNLISPAIDLLVQVYDYDTFTRDDLIGSVTISVSPIVAAGTVPDRWYQILDNSHKVTGEILVRVSFTRNGSYVPQNSLPQSTYNNEKIPMPQGFSSQILPSAPPSYTPVDPMPQPPPLPSGWEMKYDAQGRPYYLDHKTQTTSWTHPLQGGVNYPPTGQSPMNQQQYAQPQQQQHAQPQQYVQTAPPPVTYVQTAPPPVTYVQSAPVAYVQPVVNVAPPVVIAPRIGYGYGGVGMGVGLGMGLGLGYAHRHRYHHW